MFSEEDLESVQLLGHAFDVVETIDTNDNLDVLESLLEALDTFNHIGLLQTLREFLWVDTDGEGTDRDKLALELDTIRCGGEPEDARTR